MREAWGQVVHKAHSVFSSAIPDQPIRNKFRVTVHRDPFPHATDSALALEFIGNVSILGVAEAPKLINLQPFAWKIAVDAVVDLAPTTGGDGREITQVVGRV
jgi:hypothetical protein